MHFFSSYGFCPSLTSFVCYLFLVYAKLQKIVFSFSCRKNLHIICSISDLISLACDSIGWGNCVGWFGLKQTLSKRENECVDTIVWYNNYKYIYQRYN